MLEKMGKVLFQASDCSFYAKYGSWPKNINLPVTKTEHIIPCIERVPISQETGTLLQILCRECPQHPFQRSWPFSQNPVSLLFCTLWLPWLHSLPLEYFLTLSKPSLFPSLCFIRCMYMCKCMSLCMYVCVCCLYVYVSVCVFMYECMCVFVYV